MAIPRFASLLASVSLAMLGALGAGVDDVPSASSLTRKATAEFHQAARRGDLAAIETILSEKKIDINAATDYGVTALSLACDHGHEPVVAALLAAGANPNCHDRFYRATPLVWAVMRNRVAIVRQLLDAGAEPVDPALHFATAGQNLELVKQALETRRFTAAGLGQAMAVADESNAQAILMLLEAAINDDNRAAATEVRVAVRTARRLEEFRGTYRGPSGDRLLVSVQGAQLAIRFAAKVDGQKAAEQPDVPSLALGEGDTFTAANTEYQFRRQDGKVSGLARRVDGDVMEFERVTESLDDPSSSPPAQAGEPRLALGDDFPVDSKNWPGFRGMLARGIGHATSPPLEWEGESMKNIAWKTAIPGCGTSSPISWGDQIFVTTAVCDGDASGFRVGPYGDVDSVEQQGECRYLLLCLDLRSGKILWEREAARAVPQVKRHAKSSHANPTPATDGNVVVAFFGSAGIHCYDLQGNVKWSRDLGLLDSGWFYDRTYQWGFGSSPYLFEDLVIVQCDIQDDSFIAALDLANGEIRWKTPREEIPTWSSPVAFVGSDGTPMVVVSGTRCSAAYHARTGELLWKCGGLSEIVVPTPQVTRDLLLICSGYAPVQPIFTLSHTARGELTIPQPAEAQAPFFWSIGRGGPYMPTPLILEKKLFVLGNNGLLTCYDLASGKQLHRQRLSDATSNAYTASPIAIGGRIYCTSEQGVTAITSATDNGAILARNSIGEPVLATPAVAKGTLLIRGEKHLLAIAQ